MSIDESAHKEPQCIMTPEEFNNRTDMRYQLPEYWGIDNWARSLPIGLSREQIIATEDLIEKRALQKAAHLLTGNIVPLTRKNPSVQLILLYASIAVNILWLISCLFVQ